MFRNFNAGGGDYVQNMSYIAIRCSSCMYVNVRRLATNAPPAPHRARILQPSVHLPDTLSLLSFGILNTRKSSNNGGSGATGGASSSAAAAGASAVVGGFAAIAEAISAGATQPSPVVTPPNHKRKEPEPGASAGSTAVSSATPA